MVGELNKADLAKFMITHAQVSPPHIGSIEFCPIIPKTIFTEKRAQSWKRTESSGGARNLCVQRDLRLDLRLVGLCRTHYDTIA
jgi:hypothetical protein